MERPSRRHGFTILEISIVLVIIGLIIGGLLVGKDMIAAAALRAQISQIEKYNTAVNTFRSKYNGLPGDLPNASTFGFAARTGAAGRGDGNGLIEGGYALGVVPCGETVMFWSDLSAAKLVDGNFQGGDGSPAIGNCTASSASLPVNQIIPDAKLGRGNSIVIYADTGRNYYQIASGVRVTAGGASYGATFGMAPSEAYAIDSKIDDGYPTTGIVQSRDISFLWQGPAPAPGHADTPVTDDCGNLNTTPTSYNTGAPYGDTLVCTISILASF